MKTICLFLILACVLFPVIASLFASEELDRVFIFLNDKLAETWRADEAGVVHIDSIAEGDLRIFKVRNDLGGLGNPGIDIRDTNALTIENIQSLERTEHLALFKHKVHLKKIYTFKATSLQVFLNVDRGRHLSAPAVATIMLPKKQGRRYF